MTVLFGIRGRPARHTEITLGFAATAALVNADVPAARAGVGALVYVANDQTYWRVASVAGVLTWRFAGGGLGSNLVGSNALVPMCGARSTTALVGAPFVCAQVVWAPADYATVPQSVSLRVVLSVGATATGTVKLRNLTTATDVQIGAAGATVLTTTLQTATVIDSVELVGAVGFSTVADEVYELRLFTSDAAQAVLLGSAEWVVQR